MTKPILIKKGITAVKKYYAAMEEYAKAGVQHETAVRSAFQNLLSDTAKKRGWQLIPELSMKVHGQRIVPDGTLNDQFNLPRGYWEAKDTDDDLDVEIEKKLKKGYPTINTIVEDTKTAVLYQNGDEIHRFDLKKPDELVDLLNQFYTHTEPAIETFEKAVVEFKEKVPDIAEGLAEKIKTAHSKNKKFKDSFDDFFEVCKTSLNPNISEAAVDEMLIQHLLTERLFRTIFDVPGFINRNVIAVEIEKVIGALVSKSFSRHEFVKSLDRFYIAIEDAARNIVDFSDKQHFLNTVYEQFFQGYSVKVADTHGIVYTPQPIVDFMCASVDEVLNEEFGLSLGSNKVNILDPCTGTGNFIVNLMNRISRRNLKQMYKEHLFANEVMLMPYYISALNIEHAYYEIMGEYEPFEGLCFVDTLDLAEQRQGLLQFSRENTERVDRQKKTPITVIIGNPPYNVGQLNENDNNKNRKYEIVDNRIKESYKKDSNATLKTQLYDPYVKFFRWASDRLNGRDGIVCFISNNSFVENIAFDGMRKHLPKDFSRVYHVDLHGNVRKNPKLSGTTHNVFGIQVGVGITVLVKNQQHKASQIRYHRVPENWRKEEKYAWLNEKKTVKGVKWRKLKPDDRHSWIVPENVKEFLSFPALGTKKAKKGIKEDARTIFYIYSNGVKTNRDEVVYDFNRENLKKRIVEFVDDYNSEVDRYTRTRGVDNIDDFVRYNKIKWSGDLKEALRKGHYAVYEKEKIRDSIYRPFVKMNLFFDRLLNNSVYHFPKIFPNEVSQKKNLVICVSGLGSSKPFSSYIVKLIPCLDILEKTQCFPFYTYDEDGTNRQENITDWALEKYRAKYKDKKIKKWDVFYYIYGVLHHPKYKEKYADNLKRDLPRIPFAPDFWAFSKAGKKLSKWHLEYESIEPYELKWEISKDIPLSQRVEDKMRLSRDKTELKVNPSLTLAGIPEKAYEYKLGNRSALEWVVEYYKVKTFDRSGIVSDPNNDDDPEYIVKLVGQVIKVSLETVKVVDSLPVDFGG